MVRLAVMGVVLALLHLLLYRRLVRASGVRGTAARAGGAVLAVLWLAALVGAGSGDVFAPSWARPVAWWGWAWLAAVAYLLLGLLLVGLVLLALRLARVRAASPRAPGRARTLRVAHAALVLAAVALAGYGTVEARDLRVTTAQVTVPGLPAQFDGLRVAVVADLHVGPTRGAEFTRQVVDLVNSAHPDLVVMPGDFIDGTVANVGPDLAPLAGLRAPLGVFGVAGNHEGYADDVGAWMDTLDQLGVTALRNERTTVERGDARIDLAGVYDYSTADPYDPDLPAALAGQPDGRLTLLVAHQPRQALEASDLGVAVQFSGHTHGGQMWPFTYLVPLANPTVKGVDTVGATTVFTTVGAGTWGPPVRVGVPPEVAIVELRAGR